MRSRAIDVASVNSRRERLILGAILVVSVLLRVGIALYLGNVVDAPRLLTDQRSYHALGQRLLAGHGFSFDRGWYPFTRADTPTAHWSFLYSLIVAGIYAVFGAQPLAVRLVQAVVGGVLLPYAVYRLARRVFPPCVRREQAEQRDLGTAAAPLAAAAMAAGYGYFALYAATLMTETLFITVVVWSLDMALGLTELLRQGRDPTPALGFQLGLSMSLGTLLRQSLLPWVPVVLLYLLWSGWRAGRLGKMVRVVVLVAVMLVASIAPWTLRNYRVYDEFLLLNSNTGYAMYSAQHPMHGTTFREFDAAPLPEDLAWGNEAAMDGQLMRLGIGFVFDEPGRYLMLSLSRVRAFFEFWPSSDTPLLHSIGRVGSYGLALPLMVYGLFQVARNAELRQRSQLLILFAAFYTLLHVMTWAMVRYRLPVDAIAMPWAGLGVIQLGTRAWDGFCRLTHTHDGGLTRVVSPIAGCARGKQRR